MKIDKITKFILVGIIILAAILRLWKLSTIPPHLTPDEASLGYNAYSILKTGRDEYGKFLPVIFKSFGDYKPGLYIYLTVPSVAIFGLTEFAVRFPSALFGILSVLFVYLIAQELFGNRKTSSLAAFFAAVTPWLIYFSRGAWEVNVALTLTLAGIWAFLKALTKEKFLLVSSVLFAMTLLTYQGAKLSTGIVVFLLLVLNFKRVLKISKRVLLGSLVLGVIISLPVVLSIFQGKAGRLNVFSVFSYPRPKEYLEAQLAQGSERIGDFTYYLFHSETLNFKRGVMGRWFNHFSARFLFFEGDWGNPRHTAPNMGVLVFTDLILLVLGFAALVRKGTSKTNLFIWLWLILAPLPAALSRDQVHAVRALNLSIPLILLLALGAKRVLASERKILIILFSLAYIASYIYFLDAYFVHLPKHDSRYWEYGYKQIVQTVTPIEKSYKKIKVQQSYAQPYIFFLFYQKYDPAKYQKQANLVENSTGDVGQVERVDNIYFGPIDWSVNRGDRGTLFVADTIRIPPEDSKDTKLFNLIKEIKYLNGETAFRIIEVE